MRTAALAMLFAAAAVTTADAQPNRLSDVEYLQAARCRGLAASEALGAMDTTNIDALLKEQSRSRSSYIRDRADQEEAKFEAKARSAKAERKAGLLAERDGPCQRYFG